jgi:hypothetical protein
MATLKRQYTVPVEAYYQRKLFPVGTSILYRYYETSGNCQADITVKTANDTWENTCYMFKKGERQPYVDLDGTVWDKFKLMVIREMMKKINVKE